MGFVAVEFSNRLKEFAVVSATKLVDGNMRALKSKIVGKTVDIFWGRETYSVKVRGFGTKTAMEVLSDSLAEQAANEETNDEEAFENVQKSSGSKNSGAGRIFNILNKRKQIQESPSGLCSKAIKLSSNEDQVQTETRDGETNDKTAPEDQTSNQGMEEQTDDSSTISRLNAKVEKLKASVRKHKERAKELNQQLLDLQQQQIFASCENAVEIATGTGVYMEKTILAAAKLTSKTPTILARSLFRQLYSSDEMKNHSLFGRTCNANKSSEVYPSVNGTKRDALIEYCLTAYNLKPPSLSCKRGQVNEYLVQKTRIIDSLNKLLREENSKA